MSGAGGQASDSAASPGLTASGWEDLFCTKGAKEQLRGPVPELRYPGRSLAGKTRRAVSALGRGLRAPGAAAAS